MNKWGLLNVLLAATLAAVLGLLMTMHTNPKRRNDYWLKGMNESPAPADFSENANFADGQTLQTPPEGTLAQGAAPYHYGGGVDGANAAGRELKNPLDPDDPAVLSRGKDLFMRDCMPCHGAGGRGDGPVSMAKRDGGFPGVLSLLADHAKQLPDGYIYNYITKGGLLMPAYGSQIDAGERWKVVAWVRHMQKNMPEAAPAPGSAEDVSEVALVASTTPGYLYNDMEQRAVTADEFQARVSASLALTEAPTPVPTAAATEAPAPTQEAAAGAASGSAAPAAAAAATGSPWDQALPLIKKTDCLTCHSVDHKVVGPAYKDVAARYKDKPGALETLVKKVKNGGSGNWGAVPMSAHPNVSDEDLRTIITGILSLTGGHAMAPSMKHVMELVHSGAPIHCPALAGMGAINGPEFLTGREAVRAEVRRVSAADAEPMAMAAQAGPDGVKEARP